MQEYTPDYTAYMLQPSEEDLRLDFAGQLYRNATEAYIPITWNEAQSSVAQVRDLRRLPILPGLGELAAAALAVELRDHPVLGVLMSDAITHVRRDPSLLDFVTDPPRAFSLSGALDTCIRFGDSELREEALTYTADLSLAIDHSGTPEATSMYTATFVAPGSDLVARLVKKYFPTWEDTERSALAATVESRIRC
ncbi:MAG TPA: hypothetical protein VJ836_03130 [Candidatus Saccharimonadales bacterium]|nr:hypothetical protein [Candidatus Saccharimonadales bacterium]